MIAISTWQWVFVLVFVVSGSLISTVNSVKEKDDHEGYSPEEKSGLKKLRKIMADDLNEYPIFRADEVLIPFLRSKNLDEVAAAQMASKALNWRRANRIDHILKEQFPLLEKNYPILEDIVDRKRRPVLVIPVGAWDVRKVVVAGQSAEFSRFMERVFENKFQELLGNFVDGNPNQNISQFTAILDMAGYNLRQHACVGCIPIYIRMLQNYELHYPQTMHRWFLINTPAIFDVLLQILRPFMSTHTRSVLKIHKFDKEEWRKVLLSEIGPDQLPIQYGGTKKINLR